MKEAAIIGKGIQLFASKINSHHSFSGQTEPSCTPIFWGTSLDHSGDKFSCYKEAKKAVLRR